MRISDWSSDVCSSDLSGRQGGRSVIRIHTPAGTSEEIATETTDWLYSSEADAFAEGLERGEPIHPVANAADTLGNMRTLDAWRQAAGLRYQSEMPGSSTRNFASRVVRRREPASMRYSSVPTVGKPPSALAIGCMGFLTMPDPQAVSDTFFDAAGTLVATAPLPLPATPDP